MNWSQQLYEKLSPEDKERFWAELSKAANWRGWDAPKLHEGERRRYDAAFVAFFADELGPKYDMHFEIYT